MHRLNKASILLGSLIFLLAGCIRYVDTPVTAIRFDNRIELNGWGRAISDAGDGFDVTSQWTFVDDYDPDAIPHLIVYGENLTVIYEIEIITDTPESGNSLILDYPVYPPDGGWQAGEYTVEIGWYGDAAKTENLVVTGTSNISLVLFRFAINETGNIVLETVTFDGE